MGQVKTARHFDELRVTRAGFEDSGDRVKCSRYRGFRRKRVKDQRIVEGQTFIVQFLGRNSMDISRKFTEGEFLEMYFLACVIDVDAYQIAFGIIIEHNTLRDFFAVNTRFFGEIDVK